MRSAKKPGRRGIVATLGAAALALTALIATPLAAQAAPSDCAGGTISSSNIAVDIVNQSSPPGQTTAWNFFKFTVSLNGLDGMAEGCQAIVTLPTSLFEGMGTGTAYLYADGTSGPSVKPGETVAIMVVDGAAGTMSFTLTDYASTHTGVNANGWATAQINSTIERGEPIDVQYRVNSEVRSAPGFVGATCTDDCPSIPEWPYKWGNDNGDGTGSVTVVTPTFADASGGITVEDALTSPGQSFGDRGDVSLVADGSIMSVQAFNCVTTWGDPGVSWDGVTCIEWATLPVSIAEASPGTPGKYVLSSSAPNVYFRLQLSMNFTVGYAQWTDTATVTQTGLPPFETSAVVAAFAIGGGGSGTDLGTFSIMKSLDWAGVAPFATSTTFTGTWVATLPDSSTRNGVWSVAAGGTWSGPDLPAGTTVELAEDAGSGLWTPSWSSASITIAAGQTLPVSVANSLKTGNFSVTKAVDWNGAASSEKTFSGTWRAMLGAEVVGSGEWSVTGATGGTWTSPALPVGAIVTLTEHDETGWTGTWSATSLTIASGATATVTVTNTFTETPPPPPLVITGAGETTALVLGVAAAVLVLVGAALVARNRRSRSGRTQGRHAA